MLPKIAFSKVADKNSCEGDYVTNVTVPVVSENLLQGSGVFFALKIQKARNRKHLDCLLKEVENLKLLKGKEGVVQLEDHAFCVGYGVGIWADMVVNLHCRGYVGRSLGKRRGAAKVLG